MEQPEETEMADDIAVHELQAGDRDGAAMLFFFNGRHMSVSIFPTGGSSAKDTRHLDPEDRPLQDHLIDLISRTTMCDDDDDEHEELENKVPGIIIDAGRPLLAPTNYILYFRLDAAVCRCSIIPIEASEAYGSLTTDPVLDGCVKDEIDIDTSLPRHAPEQITMTNVFLQGMSSVAASVRVDGRNLFCKARGQANGLFGTSEGRELECLEKMRKAFPQQGTIIVPQILGYVQHKETKHILGFLRHWVPGRRLSEIDVSSIATETRQKWMSQIRESMQRLHEQGLVWGDGKASNIIIDDERDDAWLIDFGGGFTDGWGG